eukprot:1198583-Rhodomonas_salina.2
MENTYRVILPTTEEIVGMYEDMVKEVGPTHRVYARILPIYYVQCDRCYATMWYCATSAAMLLCC